MSLNETTYRYYVPELGEDEDDASSFKSSTALRGDSHDDWRARDIAEDAAEHYFYNRDGWEDTWPVTFTVIGVGTFSIDREDRPTFRASDPIEGPQARRAAHRALDDGDPDYEPSPPIEAT